MVRFSDGKEFLAEVTLEGPQVVRLTTLRQQDPTFHPIYHFWIVAGFRNAAGEVVELKSYHGSAMNGTNEMKEAVSLLNNDVQDFTLQLRDAHRDVEIRCGRFVEAGHEEK